MVYILSYFLPLTVVACAAISTSTTATFYPAPTTCNNQGVQWAYYPNTQGDNTDATYSTFKPEVYKTQTPSDNGVTYGVGMTVSGSSASVTMYNSTKPESSTYFALDHRAFIWVPQTGSYTFSLSGVDDTAFVWLGNTAFSGWNRSNTFLFASVNSGVQSAATTKATLKGGMYWALRLMYTQTINIGNFSLSITAPDGSTLLNSSTKASPYLLQYSCDGNAKYPAWGSET